MGYIINEGRAKNLDRNTLKQLNRSILFLGGITGIDVNGIFCDTAGVMPPTPERCYGNLKIHNYYEIVKRSVFTFEESFEAYSKRCALELTKTNEYFNPPGSTFENQWQYKKT